MYEDFIRQRIEEFRNKANVSEYQLNSHARLACYTMNKTGVASGSFS